MALSAKKGTITLATSGSSQAFTGVGFQPEAVIFWFANQDAAGSFSDGCSMGVGFAAGASSEFAVCSTHPDNQATMATNRNLTSASCLIGRLPNGTGADFEADLASFDADGFTLNVTNLPAAQVIIHYLALAGDITGAKAGTFTANTSTGNQAVTGVGFQPELVLFLHARATALPTAATHFFLGVGAMDSAGDQASSFVMSENGAAAANVCVIQQTNTAIVAPTGGMAIDCEGDYVSMDSDGFTVNWTNAPASAWVIGYLALAGGDYHVYNDLQRTSTGTEAYTGAGFEPAAMLAFSVNDTADGAIDTNLFKLTVGGTDGASEGYAWGGVTDNSDPSDTQQKTATDKTIAFCTVGSTTDAEADLQSFDNDGFTLDWTTADATAREFWGILFGPAAAAPSGPPKGTLALLGAGT